MRRQRQPLLLAALHQNEANERKKFEVALPFRQLGRTHEIRVAMRSRSKNAPPFELRGPNAYRADDACDAHLHLAAAKYGSQEFAGQKTLLGCREASQGVG